MQAHAARPTLLWQTFAMVVYSLYVYGQFMEPCPSTLQDAWEQAAGSALLGGSLNMTVFYGPACELNKRHSLYFASVILVCMCSIAGGSLHAVRAPRTSPHAPASRHVPHLTCRIRGIRRGRPNQTNQPPKPPKASEFPAACHAKRAALPPLPSSALVASDEGQEPPITPYYMLRLRSRTHSDFSAP